MSLAKIGILICLLLLIIAGGLLYLDHPGRALQIGNYALVIGLLSSLFLAFSKSNE